jgi:predicted molibdopterin-dependent oxidoreductase YjgC
MFRYHASTPVPSVKLLVDGHELLAPEGVSVAAALLAAGHAAVRRTPVTASPRGPWCLMGACFDCLVTIDGIDGVQACLTPVRDGMAIALRTDDPGDRSDDERDPWEAGP